MLASCQPPSGEYDGGRDDASTDGGEDSELVDVWVDASVHTSAEASVDASMADVDAAGRPDSASDAADASDSADAMAGPDSTPGDSGMCDDAGCVTPYTPNVIACGAFSCPVWSQSDCCVDLNLIFCQVQPQICNGTLLFCDGPEDCGGASCSNGGGGNYRCGLPCTGFIQCLGRTSSCACHSDCDCPASFPYCYRNPNCPTFFPSCQADPLPSDAGAGGRCVLSDGGDGD